MRLKNLIAVILGIGFVIAAVVMTASFWPAHSRDDVSDAEIWTCSMHPQIRLPRPGPCPICGMALIPASQLRNEEHSTAWPAVETAVVTYRELSKDIQTVGKLDYNEARVEYIAARIAGRVDRLYADFTGIEVKEGEHLADIYSPELYSAQAELIVALQAAEAVKAESRTGDPFRNVDLASARKKLRLLGILPEQIAEIEKVRKTRTHLTIHSPLTGTVVEKSVRLGQYVKEGDALYRIAELDPIWLYLDLYEYDIGWLRYGQAVDVALEAYPGEKLQGIVTFIDPFLDDRTRTVKVRVNLRNPERRFKAGMYATATIHVSLLGDGGPAPTGLEGKFTCPMHPDVIEEQAGRCSVCNMELVRIPPRGPFAHLVDATTDGEHSYPEHPLAVRASAVLDTGRRTVTYRQTENGNFEMVELQLGPLASAQTDTGTRVAYYPVFKGLREGDMVAIHGGFLIDSQTQIEGRPSLLYPQGQSAVNLHAGHSGPAPARSKDATGSHTH